jgi:hypothetical protein
LGSIEDAHITQYYTSVIEPKLRALPKQIFGTYTAENIVQKRDELSAMITKLFESVFEGTGIVPETYNVEDVKFSAEYERSIEDKMRASVEVEKSKQMLSTEKQRAEIKKTQADANAYQRKADADAEAHAITVKGTADAKASAWVFLISARCFSVLSICLDFSTSTDARILSSIDLSYSAENFTSSTLYVSGTIPVPSNTDSNNFVIMAESSSRFCTIFSAVYVPKICLGNARSFGSITLV